MIDDAIKSGKLRDPATRSVIRSNFVWKSPADWCHFSGARYAYSPKTWLLESNYISADGTKMDTSFAVAQGFKKLPPKSQMGVYESPERLTWPISHPVTIKCKSFTFKKK